MPWPKNIPHSSAWFRVGQIDVTTTVLVTAIAVISMVVNAIVPMLVLRLLFAGDATLLPVRALTWPLANPIGFWPVLGLFFFWYFGSRLEETLGRAGMLRYLGWAWLVHTVLAFAFGLVGTGEPVLAGISVLYYAVILLYVADNPQLRFGIPFTEVSFPAWAGVLVVVAISTLQLIAARALLTIVFMAACWAVLAIVARSMGLLTHLQWLPNLAVRRKSRQRPAPRPKKQSRKARKQASQVLTGPWQEEMKQHQADVARLDELLDKISSGGLESLSPKEHNELKDLSQRLRRE
ncbi:MAG TPA: hypothetical protein P5108_01620 [Marmoricola sp.]|nr:hypothetical protein [Nocardioidaceae bacterium]MCB8993139.1 hypothetical protein [Nocardioidaceae bacterium]MCO5323052.1 hypothetical protein [Nocardioidaceae bacterium]HRV68126.1 hypothetical protein [Marmoricola sp.]